VIAFEEADSADPWHGELATVAVVTITLAGLNALANWLLKDRRKQEVVKTVVITDASGATRTETIRIKLSESTSQPEVVKQLASITQFDSDAMQ
jgi:mannitol/fructose-specific phosphotransferase system IIA component (Ntr-type)